MPSRVHYKVAYIVACYRGWSNKDVVVQSAKNEESITGEFGASDGEVGGSPGQSLLFGYSARRRGLASLFRFSWRCTNVWIESAIRRWVFLTFDFYYYYYRELQHRKTSNRWTLFILFANGSTKWFPLDAKVFHLIRARIRSLLLFISLQLFFHYIAKISSSCRDNSRVIWEIFLNISALNINVV